MTLLDYELRYRRRGWQVVPIPAGQKARRIREWQMMRLTEAEAVKCFNGAGNIGIILGQASGGFVDIDLDCPEAIQFAQSLLPTTQSIFGRISKPRSHWLYRVSRPAPSLQFKDPIRGDTLLELRGDGSRQTVFPPPIHPSGESIDWSEHGDPQQVDYLALTKQVKLLAARCLIARYLPGVTNGTELWRALSDVDERAAERIQDWIAMPTAPAVSPTS